MNDVADRERDRTHPLKRLRPVASGALSPRTAVGLAAIIGSACLALSFVLLVFTMVVIALAGRLLKAVNRSVA